MIDSIRMIVQFIISNFLNIWPYLLITIPVAVAVQMSGASKYIGKAFNAQPLLAILLATLVGAFSPFCSCSVIPMVAALLISGVPLAPVMSFWIASPSMDPEAFFLSVGMIGWDLAVWRLGATLTLSLGAGLITHILVARGWLGDNLLRTYRPPKVRSWLEILRSIWEHLKPRVAEVASFFTPGRSQMVLGEACCGGGPRQAAGRPDTWVRLLTVTPEPASHVQFGFEELQEGGSTCSTSSCSVASRMPNVPLSAENSQTFWERLLSETSGATSMVLKFMALAFLLEALIQLYVPEAWIISILGSNNPWAIVSAALLGVPVYASNLTALPLIGGLLEQGMSPAAALAFLIAGPTTTIPAMAAVWGLVSRRVFAAYVGFALAGGILAGYLYHLLAAI
ncbi:MAG TPA: permease [Anaerolineales bacterium]